MNTTLKEKDWITQSGYRAICIYMGQPKEFHTSMGRKGHRCGYVIIPEDHPVVTSHDAIKHLEVHGGVTYKGPIENIDGSVGDDMYVIGFDCAHAFDTDEEMTTQFVMNECENLAKQIKEIGDV